MKDMGHAGREAAGDAYASVKDSAATAAESLRDATAASGETASRVGQSIVSTMRGNKIFEK